MNAGKPKDGFFHFSGCDDHRWTETSRTHTLGAFGDFENWYKAFDPISIQIIYNQIIIETLWFRGSLLCRKIALDMEMMNALSTIIAQHFATVA